VAKNVLVSLDLNNNELQNFVVHPLAVAPVAPSEGQMYFNTASDRLFLFANGAWIDITGKVLSITSTTAALTVDNTDPSNPALTIADATAGNSGLLSSAFFTDLTDATSLNVANTIVERDASGNFAADTITASVITGLALPVNNTDAATKQYVDNLVTSGVKIIGGIDASANPNYPAAVVGDAYHITVAGLIGGAAGKSVQVGDLIVNVVDSAAGDDATVGSSWIIMEENLNQATETVAGYSRKATQAEAIAGTEPDAYITPVTLAGAIANLGSGTTRKHVELVGDGVNLAFTLNHAFNEQFCVVQVYDAVSNEEVITEVTLQDANNTVVTFAVAPTASQYRAIVIG
jgi:hypothetical protein